MLGVEFMYCDGMKRSCDVISIIAGHFDIHHDKQQVSYPASRETLMLLGRA